MLMGNKEVQTNYHIRFNPKNDLHLAAASFLASVKGKYKIAFIIAAIEAYRKAHPYGVDYVELEAIQKRTWHSFMPQVPILENLKHRKKAEPVQTAQVHAPVIHDAKEDTKTSEVIDKAISYYEIE